MKVDKSKMSLEDFRRVASWVASRAFGVDDNHGKKRESDSRCDERQQSTHHTAPDKHTPRAAKSVLLSICCERTIHGRAA